MVTRPRTYRWLLLALGSLSLCGCFSGTIAAQIASSVATHIADKAIATSLEAQRRAEEAKGIALTDTTPDEYWAAFLTSGFSTIAPTTESLPPDYRQAAYTPPPQTDAHVSRLVKIEVWSLVIGEEKTRILENAARVGAALPDKLDWPNWQLAVGPIDEAGKQTINFLVPPDLGRVRSGTQVVVEVSEVGGLHTARYLAEPATTQALVRDRSDQTASQSKRFQLSYSR